MKTFEKPPLCKTYFINGLLIDSGFPVFRKINTLVITHCHIDHIIYANEIRKRTKCKIAIGRKDAEHIKKMDKYTGLNFFWLKLLKQIGFDLKPIKPDILLKEGDVIKAGKLSFKVIETPGHTEGSICLYEPNKKILFSGDTLFNKNIYGRTDLPGGNKEQLKKSINKLKKLKIRKLYPGHIY